MVTKILSTAKLPLISIITVVYNGEKYLEQAIKSVIEQSYKNVEYIIIDGGSTDQTTEIIKNYNAFIDNWVSEPDEGIYDAMNKGIHITNGDVIGILNSDDILNEDILITIAEHFTEDPALDYVFGSVERINQNGKLYGIAHPVSENVLDARKFLQIPFPHSSLYVKKRVYNEIGYYNLKYPLNADYDFILRILQKNYKGVRLKEPITKYRDGGQSSGYKTYFERWKLLKEYDVKLYNRLSVVLKGILKHYLFLLLPRRLTRFIKLFRKNSVQELY